MSQLRPALVVTSALLVLCCLVYPGVVTAAAQVAFAPAANGSLIVRQGKVVGSSLIGQSIADPAAHPEYLWGRPSAASNDKDTGLTVSSGSNYGPSSEILTDEVKGRVATLRASGVTSSIPVDLITKSASGLDPDLSVEGATLQVPRIARARNLSEAEIAAIVQRHTTGRTLGLLGEPRVNVLLVNLDLDALAAAKH